MSGDETEGYQLYCCAFEGCEYQQLDATRGDVFKHVIDSHEAALELAWWMGRVERLTIDDKRGYRPV